MEDSINIKFFLTMSNFIIFKGELYSYNGLSKLYKKNEIKLNDLVNEPDLYATICESDFNHFNFISDYKYNAITRENIISYYIERYNRLGEDDISLYRKLTSNDFKIFYRFEVWLEIEGVRISPGNYIEHSKYPDELVVMYLEEEERFISHKTIIEPIDYRSNAYLVSKNKIDKLIGLKKYYDPQNIGTEDEYKFTGKEEEFVLDLNTINKDIYKIFIEHSAIEINFED